MGAAGGFLAGSSAALTCLARYHLAPASEHAEPIAWFAQTGTDNARAVSWSCHTCHTSHYELCVLGAVWFIRRRTRREIHETHREPPAAAKELWHRLLAGTAR